MVYISRILKLCCSYHFRDDCYLKYSASIVLMSLLYVNGKIISYGAKN